MRASIARLQQRLPGVLICLAIAVAATLIANHYGGPTLLYALLFGMSLHFLAARGSRAAGIEFTARTVLRFGVALLGVRITVEQVVALGMGPLVSVVAGVILTILVGVLLARVLGLQRDMGLLTGGAVAICGASAAMALSAALPRGPNSERDTIMTVVGVTTLSTLAMLSYPLAAGALSLTHQQTGILLGGTIHDVAQVVGAGYMVSTETGDVATLVKLMRVAMLVPVVMAVILLYRHTQQAQGGGRVPALPGFLVAFVALVIVNSLGIIPVAVADAMSDLSRWCLVAAIAALGIKTSLRKLAMVGWRPVILMVAETLFLFGVVLTLLLTGIA